MKSLLYFICCLLVAIVNGSGTAAVPVTTASTASHSSDSTHEADSLNYACNAGSDKHCHDNFGVEFCCAQYKVTTQKTEMNAYICTDMTEIYLHDGQIADHYNHAVTYKVMCADAHGLSAIIIIVGLIALTSFM